MFEFRSVRTVGMVEPKVKNIGRTTVKRGFISPMKNGGATGRGYQTAQSPGPGGTRTRPA